MGHMRPIMGPRSPKTLNLLLKLTIYQSQKILWPRDSLEDADCTLPRLYSIIAVQIYKYILWQIYE